MEGINNKRVQMKLEPFKLDENLCLLAQKLAEDSEMSYPDLFTGSFYNSPIYKEYIQDFKKYEANRVTLNDILVERAQGDKSLLYLDQDYVITSFTTESNSTKTPAAFNPELTHGCVGVSSGKFGYKPFAYFIGAVKKKPELPVNGTFFQELWNKIISIFHN
jgi:hypothetical protein